MDKLSNGEIKVLNLLDKRIKEVYKGNEAIEFLEDTMSFSPEQAQKLYVLWFNNKSDDTPYEEIENINRGNKLRNFILTASSQSDPDEYVDNYFEHHQTKRELYGDWLYNNCGWDGTAPCLEWEKKGLTLHLTRELWTQEEFSGVHEHDLWFYEISNSSYESYYEEYDDDEFNYVMVNDETVLLFERLSNITGSMEYPGKDGKDIDDGEVDKFLSELLPERKYEEVKNDYLYELGHVVGRLKGEAVMKEYNDEIKYDWTSCSPGDYCITIPYKDLLYMIQEGKWENLSELENGVQGDVDMSLEDIFYNTYLDDDGAKEVMTELNKSLERTIESIEENYEDYEEVMERKGFLMNMLKELPLKSSSRYNGTQYTSEDGKLVFNTKDIDLVRNKIKFLYNGRPHSTPLEDLPNWVMGSVLDLDESVRIRRNSKLLKESVGNDSITKLTIFDVDGTLLDTPRPFEGKQLWEKKTGKKYPHLTWWPKPDSLNRDVFDITPKKGTVVDYIAERKIPNNLIITLTGRIPQLSIIIEDILDSYNLVFDEYHYKSGGDTFTSKINTIKSLLNRYPKVDFVEMYEDRKSHAIGFEQWGKDNGINIKVNLIR